MSRLRKAFLGKDVENESKSLSVTVALGLLLAYLHCVSNMHTFLFFTYAPITNKMNRA